MLDKILNFFFNKEEDNPKLIVKYSDCVETGYLCSSVGVLGGTIDITVEYEIEPNQFDLILGLDELTLDVIDALDHATISDEDDVENFSERYFVVNSKYLFEVDASLIIYELLKDKLQEHRLPFVNSIKSIKVKFNKTEVELDSELLDANSNIIVKSYVKQGVESC